MRSNVAMILLMMILALAFVGCNAESDSQSDESNAGTDQTAAQTAPASAEAPKPLSASLSGPSDLDGQAFDMAAYAGQVVILDVWATWCGPCRKVMPHLQEIHEEYGADGVNVVAVSTDQQGESIVRPYIEKNGFTFRVVPDPRREITSRLGRIDSIPTTFIIGPDGSIVKRFIGVQPKDTYVKAALAARNS